MLQVKAINVYYGVIRAIQDVSFAVNEGEVVTLIGANGAGKSTILKAVSNLLPAKTGEITLLGENIKNIQPHLLVKKGLCHVPEGRVAFFRRVDIVRHERIIRGLRAVPAPDCGKEPGGQSPEQCATW